MSNSDPGPVPVEPVGDASGWREITTWLRARPDGKALLQALTTIGDSTTGSLSVTLLDRLMVLAEAADAPAPFVAAVTGGTVGKLVQIARADSVTIVVPPPEVTVPAQLPAIPHFVNRAAELDRLAAALAEPANSSRVLAITSQAGAGKSALAVRFAQRVAADYPDAHLYADLGGADAEPVDPAVILDRFLGALQGDGADVPPTLVQRRDLYRSLLWQRRVLVVLDNAASEQQVSMLLPGGPDCLVLVTSRRSLAGLDVTAHVVLDTLAPAHAIELLARLAGTERVAAERAAAERIVGYCGCLPLALWIAGSRLRVRPSWRMVDLADRLADEHHRLDELQAGERDVRVSFESSYRELSGAAARGFRLLGLVPGMTFGHRAAAAAFGYVAAEAYRVLEGLVDAGLVESIGADRYRFHDLLRAFAREKAVMEEDEAQRRAALDRVLAEYQETATGWHANALGENRAHPDAVVWFDAEAETLMAAAEQAYRAGAWKVVMDLATALHNLFSLRGRATELERLLRLAVSAAGVAPQPEREVHALVRLAELLRWQQRLAETPELYDRALAIAEDISDRGARAWTLTHLGDALLEFQEPGRARECYEEALAVNVERGDTVGQAWVRTHLGDALRALADPDAALAEFEWALGVNRDRNDASGEAWVLTHMAGALNDRGRYADADAALGLALDINRENDDLIGQEWVLGHRGDLLVKRRAWTEAAATFGAAREVAHQRRDENAVGTWTQRAEWAAAAAEAGTTGPITDPLG